MSSWGTKIRVTIFGESHGAGIGAVLEGLPAGEAIEWDALLRQMARRAPGRDKAATPRREADDPRVLSGLQNGVTTGAPLCAVIENTNTRSGDYSGLLEVPRPGHADFAAFLRYHGKNDIRGGGHFSGRLTAPLVFAGAVCRQILQRRGVRIGSHILSIADIFDTPFDGATVTARDLDALAERAFPVLDAGREEAMRARIEEARLARDSVGGVIECAACGLPGGLGGPLFDGVESALSSILFGIPAVKGVEYGAGFGAARLRGSENNDPFYFNGGEVRTSTNHSGGILGGITTGMPLLFRAAFKPTPSIGLEQQSVNLRTREPALLSVRGRHDPCVVTRAAPVVEAAAAAALLDLLLKG